MIAIVGEGKKYIEEATKLVGKLPKEDIRLYNNYAELKNDIKEVEIIFNKSREIDYDLLEKADNLKWMQAYSAGVDYFNFDFLKRRNIILTNASGVHIKQISEQVIGAMIYFSRNFQAAINAKNNKDWAQGKYFLDELENKKLLIIGTGNIGKELAKKAKAFDMDIYGLRFSDSNEKLDNFTEIWNVREINERLSGMDYVVMIVPATKESYKMFSKEQFQSMDENSIFINVGRGDTVDEKALYDALERKIIKAAYIDVFEKEPISADSKAWDLDNLLFTPHVAGNSPYYDNRVMSIFEKSIILFREGANPLNIIDFNKMY